jgi:hypothetical protein
LGGAEGVWRFWVFSTSGFELVLLGIITLLTFTWGGTMTNRNYVSKHCCQRGCAFTDKKKAQKVGYTKHKVKAQMMLRGCR